MTTTYNQLSAEERGVIFSMKLQGASSRAIAALLGRAPSTITRELRRNGYKPEGEVAIGRPRICPGYDAVRGYTGAKGSAGRQARA